MDIVAELQARMARAEEAEDYETAAALRDVIARLQRGESKLTEQVPGRMGLGSSQEDYVRRPGGPLPTKPDPLTKGHRKGGRRR
ncbi:MAG: hypothetical protein JWQ97_3653 [Phenylobacterium sp.]|nr:hypothetical protein [Phenylobacterium sp.]